MFTFGRRKEMSVIVKNMEMPERCGACFLRVGGCKQRIYMEQRPKGCPLVEIPTPHGRLIAEKTITEIRYHDADGYHIVNGEQLCELEIDAETVIEAEGSET